MNRRQSLLIRITPEGEKHWQMSKAEFWELTETTRTATEYEADVDLAFVEVASLDTLRQICLQYRFFTKYFADDLAIVVHRLPFGPIKSELANILDDELGTGNSELAHLNLFDMFLGTIGVGHPLSKLDELADIDIITIFDQVRWLTQTKSLPYAVGLRGMGGECLCQVYLEIMARKLHQNPYIKAIESKIDWRFWDIHAGEEDKDHRERARAVISEFVGDDRSKLSELKAGYFTGKAVFDTFWGIAHEKARGGSTA